MEQYQALIKEVRAEGSITSNRTGVDTIKLDGAMMRFKLSKGFPAVTTKKLAFKSVVGELCAFLRSSRYASQFRDLGCKVWDDNANGEGQKDKDGNVTVPNPWLTNPFRQGTDHLGPVYGVQWREWPGYKSLARVFEDDQIELCLKNGWDIIGEYDENITRGNATLTQRKVVLYKAIDQLGDCLRSIIKNPNDRRILFHAWNPAVLDEIALPACHLLYHFLPNTATGELNMIMYVRSNDLDKGTPFNVAEGGLLIEIMARLSGMKPGRLTYFIGDAHIYNTSDAYLDELLSKEPFPLPTLNIHSRIPSFQQIVDPNDPIGTDLACDILVDWLKRIEPADFTLENYQHHTLETEPAKMVI